MGLFNRNTPDPIQESQGNAYSKPQLQAQSAVFVRSPHYGTRSVSSSPTKSLCSLPCLSSPERTRVHINPQCKEGGVGGDCLHWDVESCPVARRSEGLCLLPPANFVHRCCDCLFLVVVHSVTPALCASFSGGFLLIF